MMESLKALRKYGYSCLVLGLGCNNDCKETKSVKERVFCLVHYLMHFECTTTAVDSVKVRDIFSGAALCNANYIKSSSCPQL